VGDLCVGADSAGLNEPLVDRGGDVAAGGIHPAAKSPASKPPICAEP
jgi:hypothetical protein